MTPYFETDSGVLYHGSSLDVLRELPDESVNCCVTSPPYWGLRDYGVDGQLGLEPTPEEYVSKLVEVFREVRRVLRDDGTLWLNIGDSYGTAGNRNGLDRSTLGGSKTHGRGCDSEKPDRIQVTGNKPKDLVGIPWMVAFALRADGWYLRQDIIWHKPNPMPESIKDRCTKAREYIFLLSKSQRYFYDSEAVKEPDSGQQHARNIVTGAASLEPSGGLKNPHGSKLWGTPDMNGKGRNKRSVWTVSTRPFSGAHFAVFPPDLIGPCILAGCPKGGTVLDPFMGSGTTAIVAHRYDRRFIGIELNQKYLDDITIPRISAETQQRKLFA